MDRGSCVLGKHSTHRATFPDPLRASEEVISEVERLSTQVQKPGRVCRYTCVNVNTHTYGGQRATFGAISHRHLLETRAFIGL